MIYIPKRGDFIRLNFDPQSGHEQKGLRPALVLSHYEFNRITGFAFVCPITSKKKDYALHLDIPEHQAVKGTVMIDQLRALDYNARNAAFIAEAHPELVLEALSLLEPILFQR